MLPRVSTDKPNQREPGNRSVSHPLATREKSRAAGFRMLFQAYMNDERGGIAIFVLVLFILLMVVGGMAVDYQRHEALRADLQDALDRGSLAAANLNQVYVNSPDATVDEQAHGVITNYMRSRNFKNENLSLDTNVTNVAGGRRITANASLQMQTIFLSLVGIDTVKVNARSIAAHAASNIEITLVLDVTGSMESTSQSGRKKIEDLKIAAKEFVSTILADDPERTLISIVPFSESVNLPPVVINEINLNRYHSYANCIDYSQYDFSTTSMPLQPLTPYTQMQHFRYFGTLYGCPRTASQAKVYSNNISELHTAIDGMQTANWTAIAAGVKVGSFLMDPDSRDIVTKMITDGDLSTDFAGWPNDWDDPSTRKIMVVMSDGRNTRVNGVQEPAYSAQTPDYWHNNNVGGSVELRVTDVTLDQHTSQICSSIKTSESTIVYTIGFEIAGNVAAQAALSDCATNVSTYYLVEGVEISTAFQNIAEEITNLKLLIN